MPRKVPSPEEIAAKLRQVDVLLSQGRSVAEAIRTSSVTPFTYFSASASALLATSFSRNVPPVA